MAESEFLNWSLLWSYEQLHNSKMSVYRPKEKGAAIADPPVDVSQDLFT